MFRTIRFFLSGLLIGHLYEWAFWAERTPIIGPEPFSRRGFVWARSRRAALRRVRAEVLAILAEEAAADEPLTPTELQLDVISPFGPYGGASGLGGECVAVLNEGRMAAFVA